MQKMVIWWCSLIGVTDEVSIQIAIGVCAAGTLLAIAYFVVGILLGSLAATMK